MSDLIDRAEVLEAINVMTEGFVFSEEWLSGVNDACKLVRHAPVRDETKVVHCKDCAYFGRSPFGDRTLGWCRIDAKHRPPNYYCANADRKGEVKA